jgi:hypothetical protein
MRVTLSRRSFLLGASGGAASALAVAWALSRAPLAGVTTAGEHPVPACCAYADYSGWIVTVADKEKLTSTSRFTRLEGTVFEGGDIADGEQDDVNACAAWCAGVPECRGFSFGSESHPDQDLRNRCWLKDTSAAVTSNPLFTSGRR